MAITKIVLKPGVNRENTRYTNEGGWYESNRIRFRQGTPEQIGGWQRMNNSANTFVGICRALVNWIALSGLNLLGVGTNRKVYVESYGTSDYTDITPLRTTITLGSNPFSVPVQATPAYITVTVTDTTGGFQTGAFVTFSGATAVGGLTISGEFELTEASSTTYTIQVYGTSTGGTGGGSAVVAEYQINPGNEVAVASIGWGAGPWGFGGWGTATGTPSLFTTSMRVWNMANYGEDLILGPAGGPIYYWEAGLGLSNNRAVLLSSRAGASNVPLSQNFLLVADASRFVFAFGTNPYGSSTVNPMLMRWSDQENVNQWTPTATTQAGDLLLSKGAYIFTALQSRQEILVWTDIALYSVQYLGAPLVWGQQLLADNVSIISQRSAALASGVAFWMGVDKFYKYDGRVQTLRCDLRQFIFEDINITQASQVFASTNEAFNEVWWFYCTSASTSVDRYVVYNYAEDVWYYGSLGRTAWLDTKLRHNPVAATYNNNLVYHELGVDDNTTGTPQPMNSTITSSEFDIGDGDRFGFVWRMLPDITFRGSTATNPYVTMYLKPMVNAGSGYTTPPSVGGSNNAAVTQTSRDTTVQIEQFTGQVYVRVRGRQMAMTVTGPSVAGTTWQLGSPRIDIRPDGRR